MLMTIEMKDTKKLWMVIEIRMFLRIMFNFFMYNFNSKKQLNEETKRTIEPNMVKKVSLLSRF